MRRVGGYYDMGKIGWPKPRAPVFEDRTTGTRYILSHDSSGPTLSSVPGNVRARAEEPVLSSPIGPLRLYVDDGALTYELAGFPTSSVSYSHDPLFTLNLSDKRTTYEITASSVEAFGDALCTRKYEGLGLSLSKGGETCTLHVATEDIRITEGGEVRLTEGGEPRIIEDG